MHTRSQYVDKLIRGSPVHHDQRSRGACNQQCYTWVGKVTTGIPVPCCADIWTPGHRPWTKPGHWRASSEFCFSRTWSYLWVFGDDSGCTTISIHSVGNSVIKQSTLLSLHEKECTECAHLVQKTRCKIFPRESICRTRRWKIVLYSVILFMSWSVIVTMFCICVISLNVCILVYFYGHLFCILFVFKDHLRE